MMSTKTAALLLALSAAPAAWAAFPPATDQIADCENRWFFGRDNKDPDARVLGFAYIDPEAGFTFEFHGEYTLDAKGEPVRKPDPLEGKARLIFRVAQNGHVACLDDATVLKLGVPAQSELLKNYEDKRDPVTHAIAWASHLNQIGASEQAVRQIEIARKAGDHSNRMWFELAFAYDAQEQYDEAIAVLEPVVAATPDAITLLGELAFAHMHHGDYPRAIELYLKAIDSYKEAPDTPPKWQLAFNLAGTYHMAGDAKLEAEWMAKAKAWHPPEASH